MMKIGIFGGSFDPIHYGHLILAETCREYLQLDRLLLVPAATSPLKPHGPVASNDERREMCQLAIGGSPNIQLDTIELDRGGTSYTLDTVMAIKAREPDANELVLLIGSDSVAQLDRWREPAELLKQIQLGVVHRAGDDAPDFDRAAMLLTESDRVNFSPTLVPMPSIELSSSNLRRRVGLGLSIRYRVPRAVEAYISSHHLYRQ